MKSLNLSSEDFRVPSEILRNLIRWASLDPVVTYREENGYETRLTGPLMVPAWRPELASPKCVADAMMGECEALASSAGEALSLLVWMRSSSVHQLAASLQLG